MLETGLILFNKKESVMKSKAIIVDIDGTLANVQEYLGDLQDHQNERQLDKFIDEVADAPPYLWCLNMINLYHKNDYQIIFVTARNTKYKIQTEEWLNKTLPKDIIYLLYMRERGDLRDDPICKKEIYYKNIEPEFDIEFALDDRPSVIQMWREINIPGLQVSEGY